VAAFMVDSVPALQKRFIRLGDAIADGAKGLWVLVQAPLVR
jgi:hypothetical protein